MSPSRTTKKTESLIDLVFVSDIELVSKSGIIPCNISDHDLVFVVFKKKSINTKKELIYYEGRQMSNYTTARLHSKLVDYNWNEFYACRDSTLCWEKLYESYTQVLNDICPIKTFRSRPKQEEWVDGHCLAAIRKRDKLRSELKYKVNDNKLFEQFKKARNSARQIINKARQDYIKTNITDNIFNPRKLWQNLKTLMPGKKEAIPEVNAKSS